MGYESFGEKELGYLREVIASQSLWRGTGDNSMVSRFEDAAAKHLRRKHVLALCSGTSANETAYAALGLEPGDEVICPAVAPIFVSFPVVGLGCVPLFAECDPRTLIISAEGIEAAVTPKTRAVVVVHLNGQPAPMGEILAAAKKHDLKVVEDCSQCYDGCYKDQKTGTMGDTACFSMQQSKHITSGEGGLFVTDDPEMYKRAMLYANCGMPWYRYGLEAPAAERLGGLGTRGHFAWGHNYRMSEAQGAIGLAQIGKIDKFNARVRELVEIIESELEGVPGIELAYRYPDTVPNYWNYPVRVPAELGSYSEINYLEFEFQKMQETRRTSVSYPLPDYVQYRPGICPKAEEASKCFAGLGVHHSMDHEDVRAAAVNFRKRVEEL